MVQLPDEIPEIMLDNGFLLRQHKATKRNAEDYWLCYNDPNVQPFLPEDCIPSNPEEAEKDILYLIKSFEEKKGVYWAIADRKTNRMVGAVSIHTIDHYHNRAEIAYDLHSDFWGYGIAYSACRQIVHYGFSKLCLNRIEATTILENIPSMCLLQKLGFGLEGVLEEYKMYKGKFVDIAIFGMSASRYKNLLSGGEVHYQKQRRIDLIKDNILHAYQSRYPYGDSKRLQASKASKSQKGVLAGRKWPNYSINLKYG